MVDVDDLRAAEDVYVEGGGGRFDSVGADALITAFTTMAKAIESQVAERRSALTPAMVDWQGTAREKFGDRHVVGVNDAAQLVAALQDAVGDVQAMKAAAQQEQRRIEKARAWVTAYQQNERTESLMNKISDWGLFGGEDHKPPPQPEPPSAPPNLAPRTPGLARDG